MGIKLNTKIFNIIRQIMKSNLFTLSEMRNYVTVESYLRTIKETEAADWIKNNNIAYLSGLLQGFEIDNSLDAQLKDLKATQPADAQFKEIKDLNPSKINMLISKAERKDLHFTQ